QRLSASLLSARPRERRGRAGVQVLNHLREVRHPRRGRPPRATGPVEAVPSVGVILRISHANMWNRGSERDRAIGTRNHGFPLTFLHTFIIVQGTPFDTPEKELAPPNRRPAMRKAVAVRLNSPQSTSPASQGTNGGAGDAVE